MIAGPANPRALWQSILTVPTATGSTNGVYTALPFDVEDIVDIYGVIDRPSTLLWRSKISGLFRFTYHIRINQGGGGDKGAEARVVKNSTTDILASHGIAVSPDPALRVSVVKSFFVQMAIDDTLTVQLTPTSATAMTVSSPSTACLELWEPR